LSGSHIKAPGFAGGYIPGTVIEPPAVGWLTERRDSAAFAVLEANIAAAHEAAQRDPLRYADLSAEFSMLITRHCGDKMIHLPASLIHDIISRQHKDVTARTLSKGGVDKLRQSSTGTHAQRPGDCRRDRDRGLGWNLARRRRSG
jgi:hypothetical protein